MLLDVLKYYIVVLVKYIKLKVKLNFHCFIFTAFLDHPSRI